MCHSAQNSFGLASNKLYIYEELYSLLEHCNGIDWEAAWSMPVAVRKWWLNKKQKDIEEENKRKQ
jgi:hypothetical protein